MTMRNISPSNQNSGRNDYGHADWRPSEPVGVLCVGLGGEEGSVPDRLAGVETDPPLEVHTASTAEAALEMLSASGPQVSCVVSEYRLGETTGIDLLETVRRADRDLPFVLLTGAGDEGVASRAISAGVTDYLRRSDAPEGTERLADRITDAIARYRAEREAHRAYLGVETATEAIGLLDDERFTYVNQVYADTYGYDREEMLGMHLSELSPEAEAEHVREEMLPQVDEEGFWTGETTGLRADGSTFPEQHSLTSTEEGELVSVVRDVTERKERERRLERYRDYTDEVLDAVDDVFYVLDREGNLQRWNESLPAATGYSDEEIDSMHALEFFERDERERVAAAIEEVFETGETRIETEVLTKAGEQVPYEFAAAALEDPDGTPVIAGIGRDISERTERERELQRYERIVDALGDPVYELDVEGRFTYVNQAMAEKSGYDADELLGEHVSIGMDQDAIARAESRIADLLAGDPTENVTVEYEATTKDGEKIPVENNITLLTDDDGRVQGTVGALRDLTEREQRERALRDERDRLESLFEAIPEAVVHVRYVDGEPIIRQVNSAFESVFGYDADHLAGESLNEQIVPDGKEAEAEEIDRLAHRQDEVSREIRRRTAEGVRDFLFRAQEFERNDGTIEGLGVYVDITERKERERELELFRNLIDRSNDSVMVIDPETGRFLDVNETACRNLGYERAELLGLSVPEIEVALPDRAAWRSHVESLRSDGSMTFDGEHERADGSTFPVEVNVSLVELEREYMLAIARDVTERREREQYLRSLYEISSRTDLAFDAKTEALLELGRDRFGVDVGFLARTTDEAFEVVHAVGSHEQIQPGMTDDPSRTYCRRVVEGDEPLGVTNARVEGWADDPAYETYELACYLGTTVDAGSGGEWTLCFADRSPRETPFTDAEYTYVELLSQWLGHDLERDRIERRLAALNELSRDLTGAERREEIARLAVERAEGTLDLPVTAVLTYDNERGALTATALTPRAEAELPTTELTARDGGPLWEAFVAGEARVVENVVSRGGRIGTVVALPLGNQGLFVTATRCPGGFSDAEIDFVETAAATVAAAATRADRERQLQERERTLEDQNESLERLNRINTTIRSIDRALVQASSRSEIDAVVCEQLADVGPYELAWIGDHDAASREIAPREWTGSGAGYLDELTLTTADVPEGQGPASRAVRTREPQVVNNIFDDRSFGSTREDALNQGYQACIALPLVYEETLYGVLVVYAGQPGVFDDLERAVLTEMADNVAYAINAVERKKALLSDEVTELEFTVDDPGFEIAALSRDLGIEFSLETLVPGADGDYRAFFTTRGRPGEEILRRGSELAVSSLELLSEHEEDGEPVCLFEGTLTEESLPMIVLEHGGKPQDVAVADGTATVTVHVASDAAVGEFVEMFRTNYPAAELVAKRTREHSRRTVSEARAALTETLTDRQLEALQTAYVSGYFDQPRSHTASEIAGTMDISQPTFNSHLRTAHRKLCRELFDSEPLES